MTIYFNNHSRYLLASLLLIFWLAGCVPPPPIAPYFDDRDPTLIRLGNPFYEVTLAKNNGALVAINDKQRGVQLTNGSRNGCLWGAIYRADTTSAGPRAERYIGGCNFDAAQTESPFTYRWDAAAGQLTLIYQSHATGEGGEGAMAVEILLTPSATSWLDLQLILYNNSDQVIDQVIFPSDLLIAKADLHEALLPTLPGVLLEQPFFTKRARYDALYPSWQGLFADYVALQVQQSNLTLYTIQQPAALQSARVSMINGPDETRLVHTFYPYISGSRPITSTLRRPQPHNEPWHAPVVRLHIGQPYSATIEAYRRANGLDQGANLRTKLGERYQAVVQAPLYKIEYDQTPAYWASLLQRLPAPGLLHWVTYWQNGVFDEGYPDYLPPHGSDTAGLADLFATARGQGFLNMPYTNPTWWDDESPTIQQMGAEALALRDEAGNLRYECVSALPPAACSRETAARDSTTNQGRPPWQWIHGGYPVSPHAPAVQERIATSFSELTEALGSDLIFEDQVGVGDVHCIPTTGDCRDYSPWSPHPTAYRQGWLDHTARYAAVGLMTEIGYDRMAAHELGFHGSLLLFEQRGETDFWWGPGYWRPYPFATMLLRDKVLFYQHNLAPETFTDNLPTLRWNLAMGYQLSYGLNVIDGRGGPESPWLQVVSLLQRTVLAPHADRRVTAYQQLDDKITETRYGPVRVFANWQRTKPFAIDDHRIAPEGFYLIDAAAQRIAGAFTVYNGVPLSEGLHIIVEEHTPTTIRIYQPLGGAGPITVKLPATWLAATTVQVTAHGKDGERLATSSVTASAALVQLAYEPLLAGRPVDHYTIEPAQ